MKGETEKERTEKSGEKVKNVVCRLAVSAHSARNNCQNWATSAESVDAKWKGSDK